MVMMVLGVNMTFGGGGGGGGQSYFKTLVETRDEWMLESAWDF